MIDTGQKQRSNYNNYNHNNNHNNNYNNNKKNTRPQQQKPMRNKFIMTDAKQIKKYYFAVIYEIVKICKKNGINNVNKEVISDGVKETAGYYNTNMCNLSDAMKREIDGLIAGLTNETLKKFLQKVFYRPYKSISEADFYDMQYLLKTLMNMIVNNFTTDLINQSKFLSSAVDDFFARNN